MQILTGVSLSSLAKTHWREEPVPGAHAIWAGYRVLSVPVFLCSSPIRDDPLCHPLPSGQPLLHVHRLHPEQHWSRAATQDHPRLRVRDILHPVR